MNTTSILKKVKGFNSFFIDKPEEIERLKSVCLKQMREEKKKSEAAIRRIEKNKEWLFVYDLLLAVNEVKSNRG